MISFLGFMFSLFLPVLIGLLIISLIAGKKLVLPFLERLALSYLVGTGLLTFSLFLFSLFGIKFYFIYIVIFWAGALTLAGFYLMQKKTSLLIFDTLPFKKVSWLEWVLIGLISFKVFYLYFQAWLYPVFAWDSLGNWAARAKVFFFARTIPFTSDVAPRLGGGIMQYPLNIPLFETWIAVCSQAWNDAFIKLIFPTFFVCLGVVFYYGLKRYTSRVYALFFTLLLTALPLLVYHASVSYVDFVVGAYFFAAGICLWRWIQEKQRPFLFLSGLLGAGAAWTKDEGLIFAGIVFFVLLLFLFFQKHKWKDKFVDAGSYLMFFLPFCLVWFWFKAWQGLALGNNSGISLGTLGEIISFHPDAFGIIMQETFMTAGQGLVFGLFVFVVLFFIKEIIFSRKKYLILMPILAWLFFVFLYVFTNDNYHLLLVRTIQHRNYLTFTPLLLYALAFILWDKYKEYQAL